MKNSEIAEIADISIGTASRWKKEKSELLRLIELGKKAESYLEKTEEYFEAQKEFLGLEKIDLKIEQPKLKNTVLAKRLNTTSVTIANWETSKPEMMRLVHLALATEKHIKEIEEYLLRFKG